MRDLHIAPWILMLALALLPAALSAGDPDVIDVMYISRALFQGGVTDKTISVDPAISTYSVPMPGHYSISDLGQDPDIMNRVMRVYMPRTFDQMLDRSDAVLMHEAPCGSTLFPDVYFDAKWMSWFVKAVTEDGMALSMWGGDASFGGGGEGFYKSWGDTTMDAILPFESVGGYSPSYAGFHRPTFIDPGHELARLPWQEAGPVELLNTVETKQGATLVAEAVGAGVRFPWIGWWRAGNGKVVGETQVFGSMGTTNRMINDWRWYQDFLIYLVYFASDKPVPDDVYRAHRLREEINLHVDRTILLVSLLEFIEKFGASTLKLYEELGGINEVEKVAENLYRQGEYDRVAEIFEEIRLAWAELDAKAAKLKQSALFWVYLIEWSVVTGVALVAGIFLWSVMIRRSLYREMGKSTFR